MTRENIRVADPNFCFDGSYFYCLLNGSQVLQVKCDDGTVSFSYPLDTAPGGTILSLEYDGVYFWSLEAKSGGMIIRKWAIDSYICKQITSFTLTDTATHTYSSNDFAIERYEFSLLDNDNGVGGYTIGLTDVDISDTSILSAGDVLTFVRHRTGAQNRYSGSYVETKTVQQVVDSNTVRLTSAMSADPYSDGKGFRGPSASFGASDPTPPDRVYVTKYIWMLNDNPPGGGSGAALYKISASNGSNIAQYSGSQYEGIKGATFYTDYNVSGTYPDQYNTTIDSGRYVLFVNGSSLIFYDVSSLAVSKALSIDNIKADLVSIWDAFDLEVGGYEPNITLYRLQNGTTYGDPASNESWTTAYSYEKTLLRRIVHAIALVAEPTIIPADGSSTSTITAIVTDQYGNSVPSGMTVSWATDCGDPDRIAGTATATTSLTDSFGRASATYYAGTEEEDVKITASVVNGLIS